MSDSRYQPGFLVMPSFYHDTALTDHFTRGEHFCKCGECKEQLLHPDLYPMLERLRTTLGDRPITITSGYRCEKHNAAIGGAKRSRHMVGDAADIKVRGKVPLAVAEAARVVGFTGIKTYTSWTHVDLRPEPHWFDYKGA